MKNKKILLIVIAAAVVLVGVMLLLIFIPKGGDNGAGTDGATFDEAQISVTTDNKGVHQVTVARNDKGEVEQNGSGSLINYYPANIKDIHLENAKGTVDIVSNTPNGKATEYKIKGYEDYKIQSGIPDQIASACAAIEFSTVAGKDNGDNSADFGFDKTRAVATVTYNDNTKSIITVGDNAPQQAGTYIKFGDGEDIFLIDEEKATAFDFGLTDFMSLAINDSASDTDNSKASSIKIWGGGIEKEIELVPNDSEKVSASYKMTSPVECYANEKESSLIEGGIRGLYADSVAMVNPSQSQLVNLGLAESATKLKAVYPDTTVSLIGSKPDPNGDVNLMVDGGSIVYKLKATKAPWVETNYEKLVSEYVLNPKMTALSGMTVSTGGKDYEFKLSSKTVLTTDDQGSETESTTTVVYYNGKELQTENFSTLFEAASMIELADAKTENPSGSPSLKITYTYAEDDSTDTVEFYPAADSRCVATLNGRAEGHSRQADVTRTVNALNELIK